MRSSELTMEISGALVAFQSEVTNPPKSSVAKMGSYSYSYAAFPDIVDQMRPLLAKHKLAVLQTVGSDGNHVTVATRIVHESGQWFETEHVGLPAGAKPQDAGSAITYARRYSYTAALGLVTDEDVDGQQSTPKKPKASAQPEGITQGAAPQAGAGDKKLCAMCKEAPVGPKSRVRCDPCYDKDRS